MIDAPPAAPGPELLYGFDPLCGWCFGMVPAMRAVRQALPALPVRLCMAGLASGARVGPYAAMEGYIRSASGRLARVTGRAPSEAFFRLIATPGVLGDSGPPCVAIAHVARERSDASIDFAHAVTEAHFEEGRDLNDIATYAPLIAAHAPGVVLPDLHDAALQAASWAEGRSIGLASFPTLAWRTRAGIEALPVEYRPEALVALLRERLAATPAGPG